MREITEIIIHCSASPNDRGDTAEDVHRWHLERGWSGIGYHYIIERIGKLIGGRPLYWEGAHAKGHNKNSIGICLMGTDEFDEHQWSMLSYLITHLMLKFPDAKVMGHNEISNKTCPNFDVQQWVGEFKNKEETK